MAAEFGDQRNRAGVGTGHQPVGFLSPAIAHQHPAGADGQLDQLRTTLLEDQIEAGAQAVTTAFRAPRVLQIEISRAMVAAKSASCSSRSLEQTTALNGPSTAVEVAGAAEETGIRTGDDRDIWEHDLIPDGAVQAWRLLFTLEQFLCDEPCTM